MIPGSVEERREEQPVPDSAAYPVVPIEQGGTVSMLVTFPEGTDQAGQNRALAISQLHGIPELVARVLAGRGVGVDEAPAFLDPTIRNLMPDPSKLTDCDSAAKRILQAIDNKERVAIFGDYDVDGASSSALNASRNATPPVSSAKPSSAGRSSRLGT